MSNDVMRAATTASFSGKNVATFHVSITIKFSGAQMPTILDLSPKLFPIFFRYLSKNRLLSWSLFSQYRIDDPTKNFVFSYEIWANWHTPYALCVQLFDTLGLIVTGNKIAHCATIRPAGVFGANFRTYTGCSVVRYLLCSAVDYL